MTNHTITLTLPRPRVPGRTALLALLAGLAGALATLVALALLDSRSPAPRATGVPAVHAAPNRAFTLAVPRGWVALTPAQLARVPARPAAVLRRTDRRGLLVVRPATAPRGGLQAFAKLLTQQLARRFAGFRPVGARVARLRGGPALLYTFVRGSTVQSVALTTVKGRSWEIDTVSPGDAPDVARQLGAVLASFGA